LLRFQYKNYPHPLNAIFQSILLLMPFETERKFLVQRELWNAVHKPQGKLVRQGYIVNDQQKSIRIRIADSQAWLTIKGTPIGATRSECEYPIPVEHGEQLLQNFATREIIKTRYTIFFTGFVWEVDEFHGIHDGLIIAEIELEKEEQQFTKPNWISEEVTYDARYFNANIINMQRSAIESLMLTF
jgi:adenylate cyclase